MWDRPPRRCIFVPSIGPPVMSVSTPLCTLSLFFLPCFVLPRHCCVSLIGREKFRYRTNMSRTCRTTSDYARESRRQLEIIRAYGLPERITSAKFFHLRPINYEYRPEDCSLSGAYPFVGAARQTWEGIRFQRRLHGAILSRDDGHDR